MLHSLSFVFGGVSLRRHLRIALENLGKIRGIRKSARRGALFHRIPACKIQTSVMNPNGVQKIVEGHARFPFEPFAKILFAVPKIIGSDLNAQLFRIMRLHEIDQTDRHLAVFYR